MGGGNGAKSEAARKKALKNAPKAANSQLAVNKAALSIKCKACMSPFMNTARAPQLEEHASNKHGKTLAECFPDFKV